MLTVLQVCNVGQIVGGTAACAWTVTRSLPECRHHVIFLSAISDETRQVFSGCEIERWTCVDSSQIDRINPDLVILHNISSGRISGTPAAVTIQYLHSRISPAPADLTLYCTSWLANCYGADERAVCLQAVPRPKKLTKSDERRALRTDFVIGRICTPQSRKWPEETVGFYHRLAERFPGVQWEFVGCPRSMQSDMREACRGQGTFLQAAWDVRSRLWEWDALLYHHPTLTESFGRTVAESMRAGCIPIVDNRGGFREQVAEGCGFLCSTESDYLSAVEQLSDTGSRWMMSCACRDHAETCFSLARFRKELLGRFREAAENRAGDLF